MAGRAEQNVPRTLNKLAAAGLARLDQGAGAQINRRSTACYPPVIGAGNRRFDPPVLPVVGRERTSRFRGEMSGCQRHYPSPTRTSPRRDNVPEQNGNFTVVVGGSHPILIRCFMVEDRELDVLLGLDGFEFQLGRGPRLTALGRRAP
jgi:hypothetical protein